MISTQFLSISQPGGIEVQVGCVTTHQRARHLWGVCEGGDGDGDGDGGGDGGDGWKNEKISGDSLIILAGDMILPHS